MAFYDDMAATATELLTEFGAPVTLARTTGESTHPVTGVVTPGTDDTKTTIGILKKYPDNFIDGTRILSGDRMLILDASVQPLMTDRPVIGEQQWTPVSIETINPAGTPLTYSVQVRK